MRMIHRGEGSTKRMWMRRYEVLAILGVFLLSSVLVAGLGTINPASAGAHSSVSNFGGLPSSVRNVVTPAAGPVLSGPGEFFTSSAFPLAAFANRTCVASILPGGACPVTKHANVTNDLAMNYTSGGVLAVAYTTMTNESPCDQGIVENYSQSNIAFLTSSDNGATWSSVQVLGNADCKSATTYPSSWEPALTSLSNGTLVLAYVEYNTSVLVPFLNSYAPPVTQLVVTESYNNGGSWSTQQVVNVSSDPSLLVTFPAMRPSIAAYGSTIYLTWMSMQVSASGANPGATSQVSLLVSSNGGKSWSPTLPMTTSPYTNSGNPEVIVNPVGRAFLAYASSIPYSGTVYVLSSTNDFTSWTTGFVGSSYNGGQLGVGPFGLTSPRMTWNSLYHELYVAFVGGVYSGAPAYSYLPDVYLATSVNNGSSFLSHAASQNAFFPLAEATSGYGGPYAQMGVYQVELAVTAANNLQMEGLLVNNTLCRSTGCGYTMEVAVNSSNNGTTFTGPFVINGTITTSASGWAGEDTAMISVGTHLWYGWEQMTCPTSPTTLCSGYQRNPGGPMALTQAMISQRFTGTGTTMTFHATGLNSTTLWLVNVMGNVRSGNGTFTLSVSGVPTGETLFWAIPGPNISSTVRYYVTHQTTYPPTTLSGALVDNVTFTEYGLFSVKATPSNVGQAMDEATCLQLIFSYIYPGSVFEVGHSDNCANYVMSPYTPGSSFWAQSGVPVSLSITPVDFINQICMFSSTPPPGYPPVSQYPNLYYVDCSVNTLNFTFLSWQGSGNGSVSSGKFNITVTPYGPVTETANFFQTGSCSGYAYYEIFGSNSYHYASMGCSELTTTFTFAEHGLPKNIAWGVNVGAPNNATAIGGYGTSPGTVTVGSLFMATPYTISPMSIPTSNPYKFWVGTSVAGSIIVSPDTAILDVNYTLQSINGTKWTLNVTEEGLPAGSTWTYSVTPAGGTATTYSVASTLDTELIKGGANYTVNGSFLPGTTGVGYTVTAVSYSVSNVNATPIINGTAPGNFNISGDTYVVLWYTPVWWVTVEAGSGGTVTPASSQWVVNGTLLTLTARANPGQVFVGWTGYGVGASTLAQRHTLRISILPGGPVTEIATFAPRPPPTWTLTVSQSGLPAAQPYSVHLGGTTFTGAGTFAITNLSTGAYALSVPYVYDNLSLGTRYLPGAPTSSLNLTAGSLNVNANGTVSLLFSVQILLTVTSTVGGSVTMAGTTWVQLNTQIALTATAASGYYFVAWNGTGNGAQTSASRTISIRPLLGPVSEAAMFLLIPPKPPAVYHVAVTETGLPNNAHWNLTVGAASAFGSGTTLLLQNLNGSYTLVVPTVYTSQGIRYVPNATGGSYPLNVNANGTFSVTFTEQVLVTVDISGTGNVTGTVAATGAGASQWVTVNTAVKLTAGVGSTTWKFSDYNVSYVSGSWTTGSTGTVNFTASGPATVTMTFVPIYPKTYTGSSSNGMVLDLALLGVLLVAGLGAGVVLARRRRRQPPAAATPEPMETWQENPSDSEMSPPAQ